MARRHLTCGLCLLAVVAGCTSPTWRLPTVQLPKLPNPLTKFHREHREPLMPSPRDELQALAADAPNLEPARQQELARELTMRLASEDNPVVRAEMARVLGVLPQPEAETGLRQALADPSTEVRIAACEALAARGSQTGVELLKTVLQEDADIDVRLSATRALANSPNPAAPTALAAAVNDPDPALQFRGVQSLRSLGVKDLGNRLSVWRRFVGAAPAESRTEEIEQPSELIASQPRPVY